MASFQTKTNADGSKSYVARIKYTHRGKQHTETRSFKAAIYKKKDAEAWARNREMEIEQGQVHHKVHSQVSLANLTQRYIDEFEEHAEWSKTKANDLRHLMTYDIANRPLLQLRSQDFIDHIQLRRATGITPGTALNDLIWWRIIYRMALSVWQVPASLDHIEAALMVCRAHKLVGRPDQRERRPTMEELDLILTESADRDGRQELPMVDIILFQVFSARRISETCRVVWADYNKEKKTLIVRDMKDPRKRKGNHVTTTLTDEAIRIIERQPRSDTEPRIFPYVSKSASSNFARTCGMVGIDDLHLHDLRHEAASWLFELGMNIPQVSKITGHKSWQNMQRYVHMEGAEPMNKYKNWKWLRTNRPARLQIVK
ncbi:MAG: hypothetical protein DRQ56_05560 [Gammaproteobacteria bacterium]|nr:MAG: hypothetical protein DRQ56_05560 [Gammaproteobacteria bacterium]